MLLGEDFLAWMVLAMGGALFVGNVAALLRPPSAPRKDTELQKAPLGRSVLMAVVGLVAAVWALATLIS
jgi:hypothetical protein